MATNLTGLAKLMNERKLTLAAIQAKATKTNFACKVNVLDAGGTVRESSVTVKGVAPLDLKGAAIIAFANANKTADTKSNVKGDVISASVRHDTTLATLTPFIEFGCEQHAAAEALQNQ